MRLTEAAREVIVFLENILMKKYRMMRKYENKKYPNNKKASSQNGNLLT